jgi:O-antigen chain-terminating methyltransferase
VDTCDAIVFLKRCPVETYSVISAFHLIEHLPVQKMHELIAGALRALKPGGLLILETPNPENIRVATVNFYLDPTHIRPVPPQLLEFLAEYYGFARIKTLRLQEPLNLSQGNSKISLMDLFFSVSPDYAIVAQKEAEPQIMRLFDEAFNRDYGVSLEEIISRFNTDLETRLIGIKDESSKALSEAGKALAEVVVMEAKADQAELQAAQANERANQAEANAREAKARAEHAEAKADQAEQRASEALQRAEQAEERAHNAEDAAREASEHAVAAEARAEHAEAKADQAELQAAQANERANQAEANAREVQARADQAEQRASEALQREAHQITDRVMQAEARAHEAEQRLAALYNSISWRITAPLRTPPVRFVYRQIIRIKEQGFIDRVKFVGGNLLKLGVTHAFHFIKDHPGLYNTALKWLHRLGLYEPARAFYSRVTRHNSDAPSACPAPPVMDTGLEDLSPRAHEIYLQLKEAVERRHK